MARHKKEEGGLSRGVKCMDPRNRERREWERGEERRLEFARSVHTAVWRESITVIQFFGIIFVLKIDDDERATDGGGVVLASLSFFLRRPRRLVLTNTFCPRVTRAYVRQWRISPGQTGQPRRDRDGVIALCQAGGEEKRKRQLRCFFVFGDEGGMRLIRSKRRRWLEGNL